MVFRAQYSAILLLFCITHHTQLSSCMIVRKHALVKKSIKTSSLKLFDKHVELWRVRWSRFTWKCEVCLVGVVNLIYEEQERMAEVQEKTYKYTHSQ